jgi:hypothetical protein
MVRHGDYKALEFTEIVFTLSAFVYRFHNRHSFPDCMFRFQKNYFFLTVLLFCIEVFIAIYVKDAFVRPYVGDLLVVILLYCFFKSFWSASVTTVSLVVLIIAYMMEVAQYFNLVHHLGLQHSRLAKIILGSAFEWIDLLAYTLGIVLVLWIEKRRLHTY